MGNLTDSEWKHGERPDQVITVIGQGVPNTRMDGWGRVLDPPEIKAVAAYVYYLAKRPVPEEFAGSEAGAKGQTLQGGLAGLSFVWCAGRSSEFQGHQNSRDTIRISEGVAFAQSPIETRANLAK